MSFGFERRIFIHHFPNVQTPQNRMQPDGDASGDFSFVFSESEKAVFGSKRSLRRRPPLPGRCFKGDEGFFRPRLDRPELEVEPLALNADVLTRIEDVLLTRS